MSVYQEIRELLKQEHCARKTGDRESSVELLDRAKRLAIKSKNREWLSEVENSYANFHARYSNFQTELKCRRRSVALLGPRGHALKLAVARMNLAGTLASAGDYVESQKHLYRALDHFTKGLPEHTLTSTLSPEEAPYALTTVYTLANLHQKICDYEGAKDYLKLHREIEVKFGLAENPDAVGLNLICCYEFGDIEGAEKHGAVQLVLARQQADLSAEAMALSGLALAAMKRERVDRSRELNELALALARKISDKLRVVEVLCNIAELECRKGDHDKALASINEATEIAMDLRAPDLHERLYQISSEVYEAKGDYQAALKYYKLATTYKGKVQDAVQQHEVTRMHQLRMKRGMAEEKKLLMKRLNELSSANPQPVNVDVHQLLQLAPSLSRTELKVCELLTLGATTKEIAGQLSASRHTIDGHRTAIRKKLGIGPNDNLSTWLMRMHASTAHEEKALAE